MSEQKERLIAAEAQRRMNMSSGALYQAYKDEPGKPGVTKQVGDYNVTRHKARPEEGSSRSIWVYTIEKIQEGKEKDEENEVTEEEPLNVGDYEEPDAKRWKTMLDEASRATETLIEVSKHVKDPGILRDDDVWEILSEDRKKASEKLERLETEIGKATIEGRDNVRWLSKEEANTLDFLRKNNLDAESIQSLMSSVPQSDSSEKAENVQSLMSSVRQSGSSGNTESNGEDTPDEADNEDDESDPEPKPCRKKKALIYGGDPRPHTVRDMQNKMGYKSVLWVRKRRKTESAVGQVYRGKYDHVYVLLRYGSHRFVNELRDACKESAATFIPVKHGYGLKRLKMALQRAQGDNTELHGARGDVHA